MYMNIQLTQFPKELTRENEQEKIIKYIKMFVELIIVSFQIKRSPLKAWGKK